MSFVQASINLGRVHKLPNGMYQLPGNSKVYLRDGRKHRENGPAEVRKDGYEAYFWMGLRHRLNGPAVIYPNGIKEYWTHGKFIRREKT